MLRKNGKHNCRVFRSLGFVYGDGIGQNDFIEFGKVIEDIALIKRNQNGLILGIDFFDTPDIPVKNQFVIIVSYLHDLVVNPETAAAPGDMFFAWIEGLLQ